MGLREKEEVLGSNHILKYSRRVPKISVATPTGYGNAE
jgi:hypothetical protein